MYSTVFSLLFWISPLSMNAPCRTLCEVYTFQPFTLQLAQETGSCSLKEMLEICIAVAVPRWFSVQEAQMQPQVHVRWTLSLPHFTSPHPSLHPCTGSSIPIYTSLAPCSSLPLSLILCTYVMHVYTYGTYIMPYILWLYWSIFDTCV